MQLFECQACQQLLYFENVQCERCGRVLGFLPEDSVLTAIEDAEGAWQALARPGRPVRPCANGAYNACNWLVEPNAEEFCIACRLNRMIPDLGVAENLRRWQKLEIAKKRLVYSLLRLELPLVAKADDPDKGLAFDFLSEEGVLPGSADNVTTGHAQGLVTINIAEADDAERERMRTAMGEPYRTLLGHFRHEVGHYYWERLIRDGGRLEECRAIFGNDEIEYGAALQRHYSEGPPADWQSRFISAYASAHPWEDFAETWAHYLHIVDTLETAAAFGLGVWPKRGRGPGLAARIAFDPYREADFDRLIGAWLPLTYAVNSLNQSMGQPDLYPFVLAPAVIEKLRFMHGVMRPIEGEPAARWQRQGE